MSIAFKDPLNPSADELRQWAYTPDAEYPEDMQQDWDLMITDFDRAPALLEFACDPNCPSRKFFLACLYLLVGDCVRTEAGRAKLPHLDSFMRSLPEALPSDVATWRSRTHELLAHPESFDYNKWCWGGHAYGFVEPQDEALKRSSWWQFWRRAL